MIKFKDIPYDRIDFDAAKVELRDIMKAFSEAESAEAQFAVHKRYYTLMGHIRTQATLAEIRHSIDTSDSIAVRRHAYMPDNLMPAECFADPNEFASKQMTYAFFLSAMCPDNRLLAFYASGGEIRGFITDRENSADKVKSFKFNGWVPPLMDYADGMFYSVISARQAEVCKDLFEEMPDSLAEQANEMILRFRLASAD